MTNPPTEDLGLTDTKYAQLLKQGYDPDLEGQLIAIGGRSSIARKMRHFFGLLKGQSPKTEEDWKELIDDWDDIWATD